MSAAGGRGVLLLTEQIEVGGKRSHVEALRSGLDELGWRTALVDWASLSPLERALAGGPYHLLNRFSRGLGQRWRVPVAGRLLAGHVRRALAPLPQPALVHCQEPFTFAAARAAAGAAPVVLTVHGPTAREAASAYGLELEHATVRHLEAIEGRAYREADAVISVDRPHAEHVRGFGRTADIHVIANFVDTRRYHPGVEPQRFDDAVERWLAGRELLLCPRRLVPKNGVDVAIRAAARLRDAGRDAALIVVGEGPQRAALAGLVNELGAGGCVLLLGEAGQARMPGWYRRARAVVVSSVPSKGVEEATSIAVLEAQACGVAVAASRLGGIPEIVEHEVTGLLVPPGDPAALADALARLLDDPERGRTLGAAAARAVETGHSHRAGAQRYAEVYEAVLAKQGSESP